MKSHAKINLFLHILGKTPNNYHNLQSIFYFPDIFDEIKITKSEYFSILRLGVFGQKLPENFEDNIMFKAWYALKNIYPEIIENVNIEITKNLPIASGIGGGSANAATTLNGLNNLFGLNLSKTQLAEIGVKIGADVPSCIYSQPMIVSGIGEKIEIIGNAKLNILLINPLKSVSTKQIFEMGFENYSDEIKIEKEKLSDQNYFFSLLKNSKNDMQQNAIKICPEIADILEKLNSQKPIIARMSGSGATCFAVFETTEKLETAKNNLQKIYPNYWLKTSEN